MKGTEGAGPTTILIRGVLNEKQDGNTVEQLELTTSSAMWTLEDGEVDWEAGEVSPFFLLNIIVLITTNAVIQIL